MRTFRCGPTLALAGLLALPLMPTTVLAQDAAETTQGECEPGQEGCPAESGEQKSSGATGGDTSNDRQNDDSGGSGGGGDVGGDGNGGGGGGGSGGGGG
jgi:hypothetical protein